ncbi:MAG: tRNA (adenosine(37)-N6)-threonylcarbamoyltransferase complex ATPase subunit type 1 TsaE [Pseudohongiellaceae bacterium]
MNANAHFLADESATESFGATLARLCALQGLITLSGDLGSGKTTLSRGLIRAAGHQGAVKSPTFTIVEPYELATGRIMHFDLYRLEDPEELEYLGFRDYLDGKTLCLVEWPEKAGSLLPPADLALTLKLQDRGRIVSWSTPNPAGEKLASALHAHFHKL